jgi:energy-coupling factor transporter ATP-binding protein EcfA2
MFLPRGEEREGLYTYIEKNAGVPKDVSRCIDEGTAFSAEYLKDMDYSVPKGYEVKGDLCCPVEKTAFELNESPEKTAAVKRLLDKEGAPRWEKEFANKSKEELLPLIKRMALRLPGLKRMSVPAAGVQESERLLVNLLKNPSEQTTQKELILRLKEALRDSRAQGEKFNKPEHFGLNSNDVKSVRKIKMLKDRKALAQSEAIAQNIDPETELDIVHGGGKDFLERFFAGKEKGYALPRSLQKGLQVHRHDAMDEASLMNKTEFYANRATKENADTPAMLTGKIKAKHLLPGGTGYENSLISREHVINPKIVELPQKTTDSHVSKSEFLGTTTPIRKPEHLKQANTQVKLSAADPSQTILITGHSGSGKSTLGKLLAEKLNLSLHRVDAQESWDNLRADLEDRPDYERKALTPGSIENKKYIRDIRKIVGKSLKEINGPAILEGTQVTTLPNKQLQRYLANIVVGGDVEQSIAQRIQRMTDKAAKKGIVFSPEELEKKKSESRLVADSWHPGIEKFKQLPGVIKYNHTEHQSEPLIAQLQQIMSKNASALVVSGIHGDEPAGDVAAEKLKGTTDVISDINPTDKRRFRGKDINRHFDKPAEGSIQQKLLDIIDSKRPSRVVALHEDDEVDKPYAYSSPSLAHEVKEALKDKDTATSAHNDKTDDGVICEGKNPPKGSLEKALDNRGIAHATIETPSKSQNMDERTKTHLDVIKSLLAKEAGEKPGLWANIRAKKARGEKAAKPGSEDYPDKKQWDKLTKQAMTPEELTLKYMSIVRARNRGARRYQAAIGAGAGGVVGGAIGGVHNLINPGTEVDPDTGETVDRSRLKSALGGALKGLGIGAGIGGGIGFSKGHIEREKAIRDLIKNRGNTPSSPFDGLNYIEDQVLRAKYNKHPDLQEKYRPLDDTISNKLNSIYDKIMGKKAAVAAWQRSEGKNPEGGLNAKGRASYKKETGGTLKAPVTESNPSGERAKRQNSFCSRMCGMKRKNTGSEGQSNPDSRINKSLRKWNCKCGEAHESLFEKVACMLKESKGRCWEGYEPVPGKEAYSEDSCRPKGKKKESELEKEAVDAYELRKLIIDASRGCRDSKQALSIMGSKGKEGKLKSLLAPAIKASGEAVQGTFPFDGSHQMEIVKKTIDPSYIVDRSKYLGR